MQEFPDEAPETFEGLSTDELLGHKNWKAKKLGLERLKNSLADGNYSDSSLLPGFLKETNVFVFESAVELVHAFLHKYPDKVPLNEVLQPLCERGLVGKPKVVSLTKQILSAIARNGSSQLIISALIKSSKNPKSKACVIEIIASLVEQHGVKADGHDVLPFAFMSMNETDGKVRKMAMSLVVELYKHLGTVIEPQIEKLRDVQKTEIRKILQLTEKEVLSKESIGPAGDPQPSSVCEIKECIDPVEVLGKLSHSFYAAVSDTSRKFQERLVLIQDTLIPLITFAELKTGDYSELIRTLRGLLTDSQIPLQIIAVRCIGYLSEGLREKFNPYYKLVIHELIDKLKEKKTLYLEAVRASLHSIIKYSCGINDIYPDVEAAFLSKVPHHRHTSLLWVIEVIHRDGSQRNTQQLMSRGTSVLQKLQRDDKREVRETANALLAKLHVNHDEASLEHSDSSKMGVSGSSRVSQSTLVTKSPSMKKQKVSYRGVSSVPSSAASSENKTPKIDRGSGNSRISISQRVSLRNKVLADEAQISECDQSQRDVFTRIKSSPLLNTLKESTDWKDRLQALRTIDKLVRTAGPTASTVDAIPVLLALKSRLEDKNKNIIAEALIVIFDVLRALGSHAQKITKFIAPAIVHLLKDQKSTTRDSAKGILELCITVGGYDGISPCLPWGLNSDSSTTTHEIVNLLVKACQGPLSPRVLQACVPGVLKAMLNRSQELRISVEALLPHLIRNVGYSTICRVTGDFREADQRILKAALKKFENDAQSYSDKELCNYELPRSPAVGQSTPLTRTAEQMKTEVLSCPSPHYSTPATKSQNDEEPIGRLSAKFEHSVVVSRSDSQIKSGRKLTPAKMNLLNSPMPFAPKGKVAPASHSIRESCQLIKCGNIEQALYQCNEWIRAFQTSSQIVLSLTNDDSMSLVRALLSRLCSLSDNMTFHGIDTGFRLVETIEELLKRPDCVSKFDIPQVREIFSGLVERILDQKLSRHPNFTKHLNVLGFYLIQNSSIEVCISALLLELSGATENYIHSVSSSSTKIIDFTCKCLLKVSQRFSCDKVLDIRQILRACENYFQRFPPSQFPGKSNTPVTSIRHVITELVNRKGRIVLTECVSLNMQQTLAYQFVEMAVKNSEVNEYTFRVEATPQQPREYMIADASNERSVSSNQETMPSADIIDNVFASIKRLNQTEEGIKELFKLLKEYPKMDILSHMNALNTSHRIYCVRRLHRLLQADIASGVLPQGYVLNVPKPEDLKVAPP